MTSQKYVEQALLTEADPAAAARRWDEHLRWSTHAALAEAALSARRLDQAKRVIFYGTGKPMREEVRIELPPVLDRRVARLLHAVLGVASEAGELIGSSAWLAKNPQAIVEELGDIFWYLALACNELGVSFEEVWQANAAKLAARYPEGFSQQRAICRNLEMEQEAMRQSREKNG